MEICAGVRQGGALWVIATVLTQCQHSGGANGLGLLAGALALTRGLAKAEHDPEHTITLSPFGNGKREPQPPLNAPGVVRHPI